MIKASLFKSRKDGSRTSLCAFEPSALGVGRRVRRPQRARHAPSRQRRVFGICARRVSNRARLVGATFGCPAMPGKSAGAVPTLSADELAKALDVKPPADPQVLEDHVHQLLSRAQVSWLSKRDVLDILTNWQAYNLPISLMPPDQPGRALPMLTSVAARFETGTPRAGALRRVHVWCASAA